MSTTATVPTTPTAPPADQANDRPRPRPIRSRPFHFASIPGAPSLCPPPARMFLLLANAWRQDDGPDWSVRFSAFRVLAIESSTVSSYSRPMPPDGQGLPPDPATHAEATRERWRHDWTELRRSVLFLDDQGQVQDLDNHKACFGVDADRVVVADWPEGEDEIRLGPIMEGMKAGAIEHARLENRW